MTKIYDFEVKALSGEALSLSAFEGKVILVVNTASKCGFTPQYEALQALYEKYRDQGLVILGFPCNQFGGQEPGTESQIKQECLINYGVTFPMFSKVDVKGRDAEPVFSYLVKQLPGLLGNDIKWNFTKFLISREGEPMKRYAPTTKPFALEDDIIKLLS
ncbi:MULTISPECIES: glutathione peroxidase [unclassified Photobacterium]|uniref:glutathione peroxidase n=1 Tax=unclassified Photobacterium TaxID=2628852 RepID=UPI000D169F6F|nr:MULTISPECIES: glutathione peroxidase [unclassified Photobacterium]PSV27899.1 glutathione peroxidase [Photobacterium sp. GB-56]PSV31959.1 glutathione peroxidase [Photobacterium sp. GB-72]PSV35396.1 glutathione peroxidase [Photobacterium sp. GB-27]PSV36273.1 glutathione peroxidase [Photobacterium sp. GB-210]PSV42147.1 glutathione peroxidase [Photobacterium sp. GB-36]